METPEEIVASVQDTLNKIDKMTENQCITVHGRCTAKLHSLGRISSSTAIQMGELLFPTAKDMLRKKMADLGVTDEPV